MINHRRSTRLPGYDYASAGAYFITLVAASRECLFGSLDNGQWHASELGRAAQEAWMATPQVRPGLALGAFVVMPNHIHAVVWLPKQELGNIQGTTHAGRRTLGRVVAGYKSVVTKRYRDLTAKSGAIVWQRSFYEHVIRDDEDLTAIEAYIEDNPRNWAHDAENPFRE
jgi:putative transposase